MNPMKGRDGMGDGMVLEASSGVNVDVEVRFDTEVELEYYKHGGILQYMVRKLAAQ